MQLLRLRPWLAPVVINESKAFVLSESTRYAVDGVLAVAMLRLLDGTRGEDEIADELAGRFDLSAVFYQLIQLKDAGLIEAVPLRSGDPGNVSGPAPLRRIAVAGIGGLDAHPVSERLASLGFPVAEAMEWRSAGPDSAVTWLVLTPDYLEPELAQFNTKAMETGARWVPFKPDGIEPWIGPLVIPGETACMECLLHRLRGHRFMTSLPPCETGAPPEPHPHRISVAPDTACALLVLELEKVLAGSPYARIDRGVVTLDLHSLEFRCHQLIRRPHCPVCGGAGLRTLTGLPETDFTLTSRPKVHCGDGGDGGDGGERIRATADTVKLLETRISPITGEVGAVRIMKELPGFLGRAAASTWAICHGHGMDPSRGRLTAAGVSLGKGRSEIQARASAMGEALERYCTQSFGHEPRLRAAYADIRADAVHPQALNPFSDSQYDTREQWAGRAETGRVPYRFEESTPIDWTPAWSLTHGRWKFVPSACVYYRYSEEGGGRFAHGDSNGVAAGNCVEEAVMQGLFELVERDGVGLWWYNRLRRPALDLPTFGSAFAMEAAAGLQRCGRSLHVLDLTTDARIPTFAAVGLPVKPEGDPLLGFGAHLDARIALDRAVAELGQGWLLAHHLRPYTIYRKVTGRALGMEPFLRPDDDAPSVPLDAFPQCATPDLLSDIVLCVSRLEGLGVEVLVADLTRPETGLSVVRVMAPGLVHFWPRFGAVRLYDVPVRLGWLDAPRGESALNLVPFPF
jgi:ribosomal protein S12 methylthiotransferase accessory factor